MPGRRGSSWATFGSLLLLLLTRPKSIPWLLASSSVLVWKGQGVLSTSRTNRGFCCSPLSNFIICEWKTSQKQETWIVTKHRIPALHSGSADHKLQGWREESLRYIARDSEGFSECEVAPVQGFRRGLWYLRCTSLRYTTTADSLLHHLGSGLAKQRIPISK